MVEVRSVSPPALKIQSDLSEYGEVLKNHGKKKKQNKEKQ